MYSRYDLQHTGAELKLPENYNGCAFQKSPTPKKELHGRLEVAKPTPYVAEETRERPPLLHSEPPMPPPPPCDVHETEAEHPPVSAPLPSALPRLFPFLSGGGVRSLFSRGLDFDQLLILSLIMLLLGNDENTELILCLALLLFCG